MRRSTAFLFLTAAAGLVLAADFTRAGDDESQPAGEGVEQLNDGDTPAPRRRERAERGKRGRRGGPPGEGGRREGGPGGRRHHGPPPIIAALDANDDHVISSSEIEGASAALRTLDKNGDGELTMQELLPKRHGRGGPPEGAFGRRGRRGPDGGPEDREPHGRRGPDGGPENREPHGRRGRPSPEQFIERVMKADEDGDGAISKDEAPERLLRAFDRIDADGNGSIEKSELEEMAKRFGERRGRGRRGEGRRGEGRPGDGGPAGRQNRQRPPLDDTEV